MAFNKRTWKGRQGTGLNKFSINGASPVTVVNQPDSITEVGDALSAGNLNDLEDRIADAFDGTASQEEVTDLKNALTAVDHRVQNLESAKGDYVPVDSTKGVISVPSGKGKWAVVEKLRGVSRAENQLCAGVEATFSTNGVTFTNNGDGSVTLSGIATSAISQQIFTQYIAFLANHTHLVAGLVARTGIQYGVRGFSVNNSADFLFSHTANWTHCIAISIANGTNCDGITLHPIVRDLTLYFGSTVPTLAEIQTYYPWLLEPSDYGNSLVDSVYEGVVSEGVNIWDEEWETGQYNPSNGQPISASGAIRSKNYIPVKAVTEYLVKLPSGVSSRVFFFDADKNFLGTVGEALATTLSGTAYIKFHTSTTYGSSYANNIQVCLNSLPDAIKTQYHAHIESTLSLPTPITLRSAGIVAEEFDLKSGEKTNPLDNVDLGTLNWGYDSTYAFFYYLMNDRKEGIDFIADGYTNVGAVSDPDMANVPTMSIASNGLLGKWIYIKNTSKNASDLVSGHASWLEGVTLYYALPTPNDPTQLTPIQNPTILTEAGGTISAQTEEPIDGNFSVGFITL